MSKMSPPRTDPRSRVQACDVRFPIFGLIVQAWLLVVLLWMPDRSVAGPSWILEAA
jgi:hypothetical protein